MERAVVTVAGGESTSWQMTLSAAIDVQRRGTPALESGAIVIAAPTRGLAQGAGGVVRLAASVLTPRDQPMSVRIIAPPRFSPTGVIRPPVPRQWTPVRIDAADTRLEEIWIPKAIADADGLVLVNLLPSPSTERGSPVIGLWSRFAHPRVRLGAAISDSREGLTAEIALAFRPSLIVLAGEFEGLYVTVATEDQIAAELVALAILAIHDPQGRAGGEEWVGPWETPLVQRSTELGLGVRWPGAIELHTIWTGNHADSDVTTFHSFVEQIRAALGIPSPTR